MSAGTANIYIEQGSTFRMTLTLRAPVISPAPEGLPIDLTGLTFTGQIRATATKTDILASFDFEILDQMDPDTKGMVIVTMDAETTSEIPVKTNSTPEKTNTVYAYDIESTSVGGDTQRWLQGTATISPEVTRV